MMHGFATFHVRLFLYVTSLQTARRMTATYDINKAVLGRRGNELTIEAEAECSNRPTDELE